MLFISIMFCAVHNGHTYAMYEKIGLKYDCYVLHFSSHRKGLFFSIRINETANRESRSNCSKLTYFIKI